MLGLEGTNLVLTALSNSARFLDVFPSFPIIFSSEENDEQMRKKRVREQKKKNRGEREERKKEKN